MGLPRIVLFVEGSYGLRHARLSEPICRLWQETIIPHLGLRRVERVVPISKPMLAGMDPRSRGAGKRLSTSSAVETFDALLAKELRREPFDVAVVIWDLIPPWDPQAKSCRWEETLSLYQGLAREPYLSSELETHLLKWRHEARRRLNELSCRSTPSARSSVPRARPSCILAVCMDRMFEELLVQDEAALRRILKIEGARRTREWPGRWPPREMQPDDHLAQAIEAARRQSLDSAKHMDEARQVFRRIRGDMETNKDGWGAFLLEALLTNPATAGIVRGHPIAVRLSEVLGI